MSNGRALDRTPRLVGGIDLRSLELDSTDAFVLSCVDGVSREPEIAEATGLGREVVSAILTRLFELGVVSLSTDLPPAPLAPRQPVPTSSGAYRLGPIQELYQAGATPGAARQEPAPARQEPAPAAEADSELAPELQRRIEHKLAELAHVNHYQLLGVPSDADIKVIKSAYYELANVFHPDRHFRKNLGAFRVKLERVFTGITDAYGVLSRAASRAQYDRYLALSDRTRALDEGVSRTAAASAPAAERSVAPTSSAQTASMPPASMPPASMPPASTPPASSAPAHAASSTPPPNSEARRRALARKLGHSLPPTAQQASSAPSHAVPSSSAPPASASDSAARELERRYHERVKQAQDSQLERYYALADGALAKSDWVAAANALRVASSLRPEDSTLAARVKELDQKAVNSLWPEYLERARYEESEGQFERAAHSYERAAAGHSDARLFERAAACLLAAGRDTRRAVEHARKAVLLAPENVRCRLTLARCFVAASMRESALAELARALELAPRDKSIKDLIRQVEHDGE